MPCAAISAMLKINAKTYETEIVPLGSGYKKNSRQFQYASVATFNDDFYILSNTCDIILQWSAKLGVINKYGVPHELVVASESAYLFHGFSDDKFIYFPSKSGNFSLKLDRVTGEVAHFSLAGESTVGNSMSKDNSYTLVCVEDGTFIQNKATAELLEFDTFSHAFISRKRIVVSEKDAQDVTVFVNDIFGRKSHSDDFTFFETPTLGITQFLDFISKCSEDIKELEMQSGNNGKRIYDYVKGQLLGL